MFVGLAESAFFSLLGQSPDAPLPSLAVWPTEKLGVCVDGGSVRQSVACKHEQIRAQHTGLRVGFERVEAAPSASIQAETPFQKRDVAFDTSTKTPELLVHPATLDHLFDLHSTLLVEHDVLDAGCLGSFSVRLRRKATIE